MMGKHSTDPKHRAQPDWWNRLLTSLRGYWKTSNTIYQREVELALASDRERRVRLIEETIRREVTRDEEH